MKREFLKDLGLDKDIIDKIMAENGTDINNAKEEAKKDIDAKDKEISTLNTQLKDVQKDLKSYKDMNIDDIKKSAEDWETKFNTAEKELTDFKNNSLLERELAGANAHDIDMVLKAIDQDKLKFADGKVTGLDEQLKELKTNKAFLFKEVENSDEKDNNDKFNPLNIDTSDGGNDKSVFETQADAIFEIK